MIKKKSFIFVIINILVALILLQNVYSLGIAPSKKIIDYTTEEQTITTRIINNEGINRTVNIDASGPLSEYVEIDNPQIYIYSDEAEKEFYYKLRLPPNIEPGQKVINIIVTETSDGKSKNIGGLISVTSQLQINVPYEGIYTQEEIALSYSTQNSPILSVINIKNIGTQDIKNIKGVLLIKDMQSNVIIKKNIDEQNNLLVDESIRIEDTFKVPKAGKYVIEYNLQYDNKNVSQSKDFEIGQYNIEIYDAKVDNFKLGTIAKFEIQVKNDWNTNISDIQGEITITDENNRTVGRTNLASTSIASDEDFVTAYWDTTNIQSGTYNINVQIHAGNKVIMQSYKSIINQDSITIESIAQKRTSSNTVKYVLAVAVLILIATIVIYQARDKF